MTKYDIGDQAQFEKALEKQYVNTDIFEEFKNILFQSLDNKNITFENKLGRVEKVAEDLDRLLIKIKLNEKNTDQYKKETTAKVMNVNKKVIDL